MPQKFDPNIGNQLKKLSDKERLAPLSQVGEVYDWYKFKNRKPFKKPPMNSRFGLCQTSRNERHGVGL